MTMTLDHAPVKADPGLVAEAEPARPDPEVPERAKRRTFTASYKAEILSAYEAADQGEKGAILRREGLYSSHIVDWRRARDAGELASPPARGRPARDRKDARIAELERANKRLEQELATARFVMDTQAKLQALLEQLSGSADEQAK